MRPRPWLETLVREDASPYTTRAKTLLAQMDEIQQTKAIYLLENGKRLSVLREDEGVQYQIQDAMQNTVAEGFVSQPDLMLDAARDLSLSETGRDGMEAKLMTLAELEHLQKLGLGEPQVTFIRSAHEAIPDGMSMPLSQANRLMERLDQRQAIDRERSDYAGPLTYSTEFRVEYVREGIPGYYSGRQEIGAGEGTLSHHMQAQVQNALTDRSWQESIAEAELQANQNALLSVRDELLPYFNNHSSLSYLQERTSNYLANIQNVAEEKRDALTNYYYDVAAYVLESRQQMNLNAMLQLSEFPQLEQYVQAKTVERDLDHDGSPERVDIDDQDSRVQVMHHIDRRDGVEQKASIRERLQVAKLEVNHDQNEKRDRNDMEGNVKYFSHI